MDNWNYKHDSSLHSLFDEYDTFTVRKIKDSSLKKTCYYLKETIRWAFSSWPIADTLKMKCKTTVLYWLWKVFYNQLSLHLLLSSLALISRIYIIIIKTEPEERVRIMFMILVLLLTLASFLYVTIGIAKKIFSIFALITPIVVLGVGLLIAMN